MATGPRYRVKLRRRREGKTNYYKRRELLKSGMTRLVIRRSTKHMRVQFIVAQPNGDKTLADYLGGKKALAAGVEEAILDLGLQSNTQGSRIYAALQGVIDAGVEIPVGEDIFPTEETIKGEHIIAAAESYDKADFKKVFATYSKNKVSADKIPSMVDKVVKSIDGKF